MSGLFARGGGALMALRLCCLLVLVHVISIAATLDVRDGADTSLGKFALRFARFFCNYLSTSIYNIMQWGLIAGFSFKASKLWVLIKSYTSIALIIYYYRYDVPY